MASDFSLDLADDLIAGRPIKSPRYFQEPIVQRSSYDDLPVSDLPGFDPDFDYSSEIRVPSRREYYRKQADLMDVSDDNDYLTGVKQRARRYLVDPAITLAKGVIGVPEIGVGLADIVTGGGAGKVAEEAGYRPRETKRYLDTLLSPEQEEANKEVASKKGFFETAASMIKNPSTIAHAAIESVPAMLVGGVAGRGIIKFAPSMAEAAAAKLGLRSAGALAGAVGEGIVTAGQNVEQVRQGIKGGLLTPKQIAVVSASGLATGLLSILGGKVANKLGIDDIEEMLVNGVSKGETQTVKQILTKAAKSALAEGGLEEMPQSAQEQAAQNVAEGKPWHEGVAEAAAQGFLTGGLMGLIAGGSQGVSQKEQPEKSRRYLQLPDRQVAPPVDETNVPDEEIVQRSTLFGRGRGTAQVSSPENPIITPPPVAAQKAAVPKSVSLGTKILVGFGVDPDIAQSFAEHFASTTKALPENGEAFRTELLSAYDESGLKAPNEVALPKNSNEEQSRAAMEQEGWTPEQIEIGLNEARAVNEEALKKARANNEKIISGLGKQVPSTPAATQSQPVPKTETIEVHHASDTKPGMGQKSGYYPGTYTATDPAMTEKFGKNKFSTTIDPAKIYKLEDDGDALKKEANDAGFGFHSGNGQAEVEYLKSKGYEGLSRGKEVILFDNSKAEFKPVSSTPTPVLTSQTTLKDAMPVATSSTSGKSVSSKADSSATSAAPKVKYTFNGTHTVVWKSAKTGKNLTPRTRPAKITIEASSPEEASQMIREKIESGISKDQPRTVTIAGTMMAVDPKNGKVLGEKIPLAEPIETPEDLQAQLDEANGLTPEELAASQNPDVKKRGAEGSSFYSRLTRTVEQSQQPKASGSQWKATIKNSKIGVNRDEYNLVGVDDLEDGKTYTKQEVLDYLKANEVVVKDVTLGEDLSGDSKSRFDEIQSRYKDLVDEIAENRRKREEGLITMEEGRDNARRLSAERSGLDDEMNALNKQRSETHFSTYQLPGGKEGSYREVLLTVPQEQKARELNSDVITKREDAIKSLERNDWLGFDNASQALNAVLTHPDWAGRWDVRGSEDVVPIEDFVRAKKKASEINWRDGHSQYESTPNPIVRLRFNERTTSDGKKMLFLEEVQSPQKGQFEKMPALFQKNWREIAFKWALNKAATNGFDAVGWTTGEQQAERYSLAKQVESIKSEAVAEADDVHFVDVDVRGEGKLFLEVENGKVREASRSNGNVVDTLIGKSLDEIIGKEMAGKILSQNPGTTKTYSGLDLSVGGEGLKKLYDVDFRNVVNGLLAVKKSGQKVGTAEIPNGEFVNSEKGNAWVVVDNNGESVYSGNEHTAREMADRHHNWTVKKDWKREGGLSVHALEITPEIRASALGGQPMFSEGTLVQNPISEKDARAAVKSVIGEVPDNVRFVNDKTSKRGEVTMIPGRKGIIVLNLAKLDSAQSVIDTLHEELIHAVWDSPEVADARAVIEGLVTDEDIAKQALEYDADIAPEEAANELARKLYAEHVASNVFQRALNQITLAIKKFFGINLNRREAAMMLMREAVKNKATQSKVDKTRGAEGEETPYEAETRIFGDKAKVFGRSFGLNKEFRQEYIDFAKGVLDEAGTDAELSEQVDPEDGTLNRVWVLKQGDPNIEDKGRKLIQLVERELSTGNVATAHLVASIRDNYRDPKSGMAEMTEPTRNRLFQLTHSKASALGTELGAQGVFKRSQDEMDKFRNIDVYLTQLKHEAFGGPAIDGVLSKVVEKLKGKFTPEKIAEILNQNPTEAANLEKATGMNREDLIRLISQVFDLPFYKVSEVGERVSKGTKDPKKTQNDFDKIFGTNIKKETKDALNEVDKELEPDQKDILKSSLLWKKITEFVMSGGLDSTELLTKMAKEHGWFPPTKQQIDQMRKLVAQEVALHVLPINKLKDTMGDKVAMDRLRTSHEAAILDESIMLKRKAEAIWSQLAKPINFLNWGELYRKNNNAAIMEWIQANLLLKAGFATRQFSTILSQMPIYNLTRAFGNAYASKEGDFWGSLNTELKNIKFAYKGLRSSTTAARANLAGRGQRRDIERLMQGGMAIFERMQAKADAAEVKGDKSTAAMYRMLAFMNMGYRVAAASDAFQGNPAEYQEMASQVSQFGRKQGWSKAAIDLHLDNIIGGMSADIADAQAFVKSDYAERGVDLPDVQVREKAWNVAKARAYQKMRELDMPADAFIERNNELRNQIGWNLKSTGGFGGVVANSFNKARNILQEGGTVTAPLLPFTSFGNAIGTGINRLTHFTPFAFTTNLGVEGGGNDPWWATPQDRAQRKTEAIFGTVFGGLMVGLVLKGLLKVQIRPPQDKEERDLWESQGHKAGTVEMLHKDGSFTPFSLTTSPFAPLSPYLAASGAVVDVVEKHQRAQKKIDVAAEKAGVDPGKAPDISVADFLGVAASAATQMISGGRTASGFVNSMGDAGNINLTKVAASTTSAFVPLLPAAQEGTRLAGVNLDAKIASFTDFLLPLPTSAARRVNMLGEPVGTKNDVQRIFQILTGGTYPGIVKGDDAKTLPAYESVFASGFRPASFNPAQGYPMSDGTYRPLTEDEAIKYTVRVGELWKNRLIDMGRTDNPKEVRAAYSQAKAEALEEVGVQPKTSKSSSRSSPSAFSSRSIFSSRGGGSKTSSLFSSSLRGRSTTTSLRSSRSPSRFRKSSRLPKRTSLFRRGVRTWQTNRSGPRA